MSEQEASSTASSAPRRWQVRVWRWLWHGLNFVWGTLIVGIVIGTIANLNTTTMEAPLAKLFIVHLALTYPLPVWSSLGLLLALTLLSWFGSRDKQTVPIFTLSARDRVHLLRRLRIRYEQMLAQSLQGAVQVELELVSRPAAIQNAVSLSMRLPDQPEQMLSLHTSIAQAYELAQQELLILGEPGAGKSTLLVELAHYLVERAEQDETRPLPILLPLSTWAVRRPPLDEWLSEELARLYDISPRLSQQYIQAELVLPLLDGLDEMEEAARPGCVAAINTYHRNHLQPLVVCSRTGEYEAATRHERIALHTAVVIQPFSYEEVDAHLEQLGKPLAGLRAALRKNPVLRELATTPLILQALTLTYHGTSVRELSRKAAELRKQIWDDYVQHMISRKGDAQRYPFPITNAWLHWLAQEMRSHNQTIFSLEELQPDWLPTRQRVAYRGSVGLCYGLAFGLVIFGIPAGMPGGLHFGLVLGVLAGLFFWLLVSMLLGSNQTIQLVEVLSWSWQKVKLQLLAGLFVGSLIGLYGGLLRGLFAGLFAGLSAGLYTGLLSGLFVGLSQQRLIDRLMLSPNEGIRRSAKNGLLVGSIAGLPIGLFFGLFFGLFVGPLGGLFVGLALGLLAGVTIGLLNGLDAALQHYILRFWLWRTHTFPWKAVSFLDDATARILLRRVDGGYSFIHRLLLDHFADLEPDVAQ